MTGPVASYGSVELVRHPRVPDEDRPAVHTLVAAAEERDGVSPVDDAVRLDLGGDGVGSGAERPGVVHLLAYRGDRLVGYGHIDGGQELPGAHLVVAPDHRRQGVGSLLLSSLAGAAFPRPLRVWAHGDGEGARGLAARQGLRRVRHLWRMRRPLDAPLDPPVYPSGIQVRTFVPGRDDQPWLDLNAEVFAGHPEQGLLGLNDLHRRCEQPWFDPAGFFLAERDGELLGFHWTKVHPAGALEDDPVGEVYAVGVSPAAQGLGLGRALTTTGLLHLRERGLPAVVLYVDGDNAAAIATYRRLGFVRDVLDVMYEVTPSG